MVCWSSLGNQAGRFSKTIDAARVRTRAVGRVLRGVEATDAVTAERLLKVDAEMVAEDEPDEA